MLLNSHPPHFLYATLFDPIPPYIWRTLEEFKFELRLV
jgi:hypothetical protein